MYTMLKDNNLMAARMSLMVTLAAANDVLIENLATGDDHSV